MPKPAPGWHNLKVDTLKKQACFLHTFSKIMEGVHPKVGVTFPSLLDILTIPQIIFTLYFQGEIL